MDDSMVPPEELDYGTAVHHFRALGRRYFRICHELGGLRPDGAVLDVGCGFGRIAAPLTDYLDDRGRYEGFDVVPVGVRWCRERIASRYPNFRFTLVDVGNATYNARGAIDARGFQFPYDDRSFDLVVARSLFTHMAAAEVDRYLGEIARVLRPDGRCVVSYFLVDEESRRFSRQGLGLRAFPHREGVSWYEHPAERDTVAYEEEYILGLYDRHRLRRVGPVYHGSWCGRPRLLDSQDVIIAEPDLDPGPASP
jgi:SAM-dependent methyltransferase